MRRAGDVEDHRSQIPVREVGARRRRVDSDRMDEDGALAFPEGFGCDPRADLHRMPRIRGVEDPKAGARRVAGELRERDRRVDVGAAADRLQPDLVRSAGIGAEERELLRRARVGDVVEPEAAVRVRARAILEADGGELAGEARRRRMLDDRLLRPRAANGEIRRSVRERRDMPWPARLAQVVDADALRGTSGAVPAREVGEALVDEDVARVAATRIGVAQGANLVRAARRECENERAERAEQSPHAWLDVEKRRFVATG